MDTRMSDILFGAGRGPTSLQGTFVPQSLSGDRAARGSVLATFNGLGSSGRGREKGLALMESLGLISSQQAAAGLSGAGSTLRSPLNPPVVGVGESAAFSAATSGASAVKSSNPIYDGLLARSLMAQTGFVPPTDLVADLTPAVQSVAEDAAPSIVNAVEGAAVGRVDDALGGLARELTHRSPVSAFSALDDAVKALPTKAPVSDDLLRGVKSFSSAIDDTLRLLARVR